jgi:hypothetical protein
MIRFKTKLEQFGEQGEKTGWTYLKVPSRVAGKLIPGQKKSFRVKGKIDELKIAQVALVPMGGGDFILAVNAGMRKCLKKRSGHEVKVEIEVDNKELAPPKEFVECLKDEPLAYDNYFGLPKSHQHYFTRWISSAKTTPTRAKRIAQAVNGLAAGKTFADVIRAIKQNRQDLPEH